MGAVAAVVLAAAVAGGCAQQEPPPPAAAPVTVVSVDGWAAMTWSNGMRVVDVGEAGSGLSDGECETRFLVDRARSELAGAQIAEARESSSPYGQAPAGYDFARVDYADSRGAALVSPWRSVREQWQAEAYTACRPAETVEPAPVSGLSDPSTEIDVDRDEDHNMPDGALTGGYCARKWWC